MGHGMSRKEGKPFVPNADRLFNLSAIWREFRGLRIVNFQNQTGGAAYGRLTGDDLHPAKGCGGFNLPLPHAKRARESAGGQLSGVPVQNVQDAVQAFAAEIHITMWLDSKTSPRLNRVGQVAIYQIVDLLDCCTRRKRMGLDAVHQDR